MQSFEKLASFYLGRRWDPTALETVDEPLLYDSKDLLTHALCVGMTGSGKTGLCACLLEEAAIDGVPSIVIDPKGDMGNLLLTFPQLRPRDFRPWIDPGAATREGKDPDEFASSVSQLWRKGLAQWGQGGERIRRLREAADFTIYTPGSQAGVPLSVVKSFDAPPEAVMNDAEALADRVEGATSGLLSLAGIDEDPSQSREHSLLSNILLHAWRKGHDVTLADLIRGIQKPPFERLGVLDLESFYPSRDRFKLAMQLNNLIASPSFQAWSTGEPIDVQRLLYTSQGKPRVSILSIAHLNEAERMFFVTTLLHEVVAWMRQQQGTGSLRAVLFMDEIFGFFPPTANPPSKRPMLTLLKQARAYGLGVVLATQNPVDLDYKGLSNTGTWFLGRLQTERDKARVLDGLEGALSSAGKAFDRGTLDAMLSGLDKRVFLMNNVHDETPVTFHTRWAMSYLRGPLSREQLEKLSGPQRQAALAAASSERPKEAPKQDGPPPVPAGVEERFLVATREVEGDRVLYRPHLYVPCKLHYAHGTYGVDTWRECALWLKLDAETDVVDWDVGRLLRDPKAWKLHKRGVPGARFGQLPAVAQRKTAYKQWQRAAKSWLYENEPLVMWKCKDLKLNGEPGESEADFRIRVGDAARERRDLEFEKLRARYQKKIDRVHERIRKADERIDREEDQLSQKRRDSWISMGTGLIGALFGRRSSGSSRLSKIGSAMKAGGRVSKEKGDVARAKAELEAQREALADLERELADAVEDLEDRWHPRELELRDTLLRPRKSDLKPPLPTLVWAPWTVDAGGIAEPAYRLPDPETNS